MTNPIKHELALTVALVLVVLLIGAVLARRDAALYASWHAAEDKPA